MNNLFDDADVIHSYTRAQAIADGVLVDLTEWAKETGFTVPVAVTRAVWVDVIEWPEGRTQNPGQSTRGRAHDVLWMLYAATRMARSEADMILYKLKRVSVSTGRRENVQLKAVIGPGDTMAPVLTIMLPDED